MKLTETRRELARALAELRGEGERIVLVPTMGYLHEGHLSLMERAREEGERIVLSIFVNPTQFGPDEDFQHYPRDLDRDLNRARERGVDVVFAPSAREMYPKGEPRVTVDPGALANRYCGAHRPGHFRGVLTVVAKLLGLVRPDGAVFGRKDLQQTVLVQQMVADLELGSEILLAPLVRERDGLALSSRNAMLADTEREEARGLYRGLDAARAAFRAGERDRGALLDAARERMEEHRGLELQYLEVARAGTLAPVEGEGPTPEDAVLLAAGFVGRTRLIDNVVLGQEAELPGDRLVGESAEGATDAAAPPPEPGPARSEDLPPIVKRAADGDLPDWARVTDARKAHLERVAQLMDEWARSRSEESVDQVRWRAAGYLHDALRDESPAALRQVVPRRYRRLPDPLLHGPAAAAVLREEGVADEPLLRAVAYHTMGHPELDDLGRALYAADFLEPGRNHRPDWAEVQRSRMPSELDDVVRQVALARITHLLDRRRPVQEETAAFWNRLAGCHGS